MNRRSFITGMAGILSAGYAPAFVGSSVLMPVKKIWTPKTGVDLDEFMAEIKRRMVYRELREGFKEKFILKYSKFEDEWRGVIDS